MSQGAQILDVKYDTGKDRFFIADNDDIPAGSIVTAKVNDVSGGVEFNGPDGAPVLQSASTKPIFVMGGDHPYSQWFGTDGADGMAAMYLDRGVQPYIAINTTTSEEQDASGIKLDPVGAPKRLTYANLRELQDFGCEIVSHGHRHPTSWERLNTGIRIRYLGAAGVATVHVENSYITLTGGGGAENAQITYAANLTIAEIVSSINMMPNWSAVMAPELTGDEPSKSFLRTSAARNVKAATNNQYFAASGGIVVDWQPGTGGDYKERRCSLRRTSSPAALKLMIGGVVKLTIDLTVTTTLSGVVAAINALAISGLRCNLTNNGIESVSRENYLQGDEASTTLPSGGNASKWEAGHQRAIIVSGLGQMYCVHRQLSRSHQLLKAEGLRVSQFAQSGAECSSINLGAMTEYRGARVDVATLSPIAPRAMPTALLAKGDWYPHFAALYASYPTVESLNAVTRALIDSGPWYVNMLCHSVLVDGTSGYAIENTDITPYYDQTESNLNLFLLDVKSKIDAGEIICPKPSTAQDLFPTARMPGNMLFNPRFQNSGAVAVGVWNSGTGVGSMGTIVPGWHFASNSAAFTSVSPVDDGRGDGAGKIKWTGTGTAEGLMLECATPLEPGVYEFGICVEMDNAVSAGGGYVEAYARPSWGAYSATRGNNGGVKSNRVTGTGVHNLTLRVVAEPARREMPAIFGKAGPYDLSVNNQITLQFDGKAATTAITVSGATPSATTAGEVAAAINNGLQASSTYGYAYRNCANVEQGVVVVRGVEFYSDYVTPGVIVAGSATSAVFGAETLALPGADSNDPEIVTTQIAVYGYFPGNVTLYQPYLKKVSAL